MPQAKWRLSRTLKRAVDYRPIKEEDLKYVWAAYKTGHLAEMEFPKELTPEQFRAAFGKLVSSTCQMAWMLIANTKRGFIPVGMVLCAWAPGASHLVVVGISWMPWASARNVVECTVGFFNGARKEFSFMGYALEEHKRMYVVCCQHGIMRRVGTSYTVMPEKHVAIFETIKRKNLNVVSQ